MRRSVILAGGQRILASVHSGCPFDSQNLWHPKRNEMRDIIRRALRGQSPALALRSLYNLWRGLNADDTAQALVTAVCEV